MLKRGAQYLMENTGMRAKGPGSWREWMVVQQWQQQQLYQSLAEQQRALLNQMAASQAHTNAQLWEQVTKSMARVGAEAQSREG